MRQPFPPELVTAQGTLHDAFVEEADRLGFGRPESEKSFALLPGALAAVRTIKIFTGPAWRYVFGAPFHLGGASGAFGIPHQAPLVSDLVRATIVAARHLTVAQLSQTWLPLLAHDGKHLDAVREMLAVANVNSGTRVVYEPSGMGEGSSLIDWLLELADTKAFLLEVKNRPGQLAQELLRIQPGMEAGARVISGEPVADFNALFRSTFSKFLPIVRSTRTQGVALFTSVKVPGVQFGEFFRDSLSAKVHFVALVTDDLRVNLEAVSPAIHDEVLGAFGWREGADLIY